MIVLQIKVGLTVTELYCEYFCVLTNNAPYSVLEQKKMQFLVSYFAVQCMNH